MGADTRVLNRVRIEWHRDVFAYLADCACGETELHARLSESETWALTHTCTGGTMTRPPAVAELLGVWDAQGHFRLDVTDAVYLVAWVKTLEQRNEAARAHIDRARAHGNDVVRSELVTALDVLAGDA